MKNKDYNELYKHNLKRQAQIKKNFQRYSIILQKDFIKGVNYACLIEKKR